MKITFEEKDILAILRQNVKDTNLLNLADKDFNIELEVDGSEVSAHLDTDIDALVQPVGDKPAAKKPQTRRKAKSKPKEETKAEQTQTEEPAKAEESAPEPKEEVVEKVTPDTKEEPDVSAADANEDLDEGDAPPFNVDAFKKASTGSGSADKAKSLFS